MQDNRLNISLAEFKAAMKLFVRKNVQLGPVLLAYEGGFLSIESGEVVAVMRATGSWNGRASFSPSVLKALAKVPPSTNTVPLAYADGHLLMAGITIPCLWASVSKALVADLLNPTMLELLALGRTLARAEVRGTELGKRISVAARTAERRITGAAKLLDELGVSERDIRQLVETRVQNHIG